MYINKMVKMLLSLSDNMSSGNTVLNCLLSVVNTCFMYIYIYIYIDRLCGLVVRVSAYRYRGLGFDSRRYQIF